MAEPGITPSGISRRRRVLEIVTLVTVLAAAAGGVFLLSSPEPEVDEAAATPEKPATPAAAAVKSEVTKAAAPDMNSNVGLVGSRTCAECHPGESALHARSGHARTLRPAAVSAVARWLDGQTIKDPEYPDATWTYTLARGRFEVERAERGKAECFPLDYALGSGANGVTFVSVRPPHTGGSGATGFEHRLSYFANGPKSDITPGQRKDDAAARTNQVGPHGRTLDSEQLAHCLGCHATTTSGVGPGRVDVDDLVRNVSCEMCHGPGRSHVEAARRNASDEQLVMPFGSAGTTPRKLLALCGQCHRQLNDVSPSSVAEENHDLARFQPVGLSLSRCFNDGKSGLSCTSCHDPHAKVARGYAAYEAVCLQCHSPVRRKSCPISTQTGCINCHMPRRTVSVEFKFTDHWIRIPDRDTNAAAP